MGRPVPPVSKNWVETVRTDFHASPDPPPNQDEQSVFAEEFRLKALGGGTITVRLAEFKPGAVIDLMAAPVLELRKQDGPWVRATFNDKTLSPFAQGPFAADLGGDVIGVSGLNLKRFNIWLRIRRVTVAIAQSWKQGNGIVFAVVVVVLVATVLLAAAGSIPPFFTGYVPFLQPLDILDWLGSYDSFSGWGKAVSVALHASPALFVAYNDYQTKGKDWDFIRNFFLSFASVLAWAFLCVLHMNWLWAGTTSVLVWRSVENMTIQTSLSKYVESAHVEARTQAAYAKQSREFLRTLIRLAHDALHIRFKDGEIYPRTGAFVELDDVPRWLTNMKDKDRPMLIDPMSEHQTLTTPAKRTTVSMDATAPMPDQIRLFCAEITKMIIVARLDPHLKEVLTSLMKLHLLLRTVVFHGLEGVVEEAKKADANAEPMRLCEDTWRKEMLTAWKRSSAHEFERAAFLFVWRDFLTCQQRTAKSQVSRTLASLIEDRRQTAICEKVFRMNVVSGEAFRRVDNRKWFVVENRYVGRLSNDSPVTCTQANLPELCLNAKPHGRTGKARNADDACVDAILIFLGLLWAENRRLLLRVLTDKDVSTQTISQRMTIALEGCEAICGASEAAASEAAASGAEEPSRELFL